MLLSLVEYRRHLRVTLDAVLRAGEELESQAGQEAQEVIWANQRYRRARERERARRAARWFES